MGFDDEDFNKIIGISNTQLYKMAGNSIVVNVLENLFLEIFETIDFEEHINTQHSHMTYTENNKEIQLSLF